MGSLTSWHNEVKRELERVLPTYWGPADELPQQDGSVVPCVVLWPTAGAEVSRNGGRIHQRNDSVRAVFVSGSILETLAAVSKGRAAIEGSRLIASTRNGGKVREGGFIGSEPLAEPGTDPVRVSLSIQFDAISKEPR